eukprot:687461_1
MMAPTEVTTSHTHLRILFVRHSRVYIEHGYQIHRVRRRTRAPPESPSVVWEFLPMLLLLWFVLLIPPSDLSRAAKLDLLLLLPILTARLARRRAALSQAGRHCQSPIDFDEFRPRLESSSSASSEHPHDSAAGGPQHTAALFGAASIDWAFGDVACAPFMLDEDDLVASEEDDLTASDCSAESDDSESSATELDSDADELDMSKIEASQSKCGAYWATDGEGARVGVFKPADEECGEPDGIGFVPVGEPSTHRAGVVVGDAWKKEIAAYRLDHGHVAGVPRTRPYSFAAPGGSFRTGSLQDFVPNTGSSEDFGPAAFDELSVQAIALLDLRLFNLDRHQGNMLVSARQPLVSTGKRLVPIDHGLSLPSWDALGEACFEWMDWEQVSILCASVPSSKVRAFAPLVYGFSRCPRWSLHITTQSVSERFHIGDSVVCRVIILLVERGDIRAVAKLH